MSKYKHGEVRELYRGGRVTFTPSKRLFKRDMQVSMPVFYQYFTVQKDGVGIGSIRYYVYGNVARVDKISIDVESERRKGYATLMLEELLRRENVVGFLPTADGFSEEGRALFEAFYTGRPRMRRIYEMWRHGRL